MSDLNSAIFKTAKPSPATKAEITSAVARGIIDDEAAAREKKTARLQALRLEREAAEAEEAARLAAAAPAPKAKAKAKKTVKKAKA